MAEGRLLTSPRLHGSIGDSCDNDVAETINSLHKAEVIRRRGPWRLFEAVEFADAEMDRSPNGRWLLSPIGNVPAAEAEARSCVMPNEPAMAA